MTPVAAPEQVLEHIPIAVEPRYDPPHATIDADSSKTWLRRAMPIVLAHKAPFAVSLSLAFIGLVLQVQIPKVLNDAIGSVLVKGSASLSHYVIVVSALGVLAGVTGFVARLYLMKVAYAVEFDLRNLMYQHFTRLSFGFYDTAQSGQLISRANSDIRSVQMYLTFGPFIIVQCVIAVIAFGYMLSIDVPLAFVAMSTTPSVYLVARRMRRQLFPASWLIQSRLAEVATIVDENINGVRVVKAFAAEPREVRNLTQAANRLRWAYVKDADLRAKFAPLVQNLSQLGLAFVLLLGGYQVIHGEIGVGAILAFSAYIVMLQAPFQMLGMLVMLGQRAAASAQRIYEVLDERPTVVDRPGATQLLVAHGEVVFDNVVFGYGADQPKVLDGVDLRVAPGETVALVGRTGSGKSTAARLLMRFYDVDAGAIRIDGQDIRDVTLTSLRHSVGIVLDEAFLFSASIRDNIAYGRPDASLAEVRAAARAAGADEFISALSDGYDTVVGERGYTLSGGQRQRISLARSLLIDTPILILDDATSSIDVEIESQIHEALRALNATRTTLLIAHRLSTISLADRVVVIDGGRVIATGTHDEQLATSPVYVDILAQQEVAVAQEPAT